MGRAGLWLSVVSVFCIMASALSSAGRADPQLLARWSFDGTTQDSVGGYGGELLGTGPATYVPGAAGQAIALDRALGQVVLAENSFGDVLAFGDGDFSLSVWVRTTDPRMGTVMIKQNWGRGETGSGPNGYGICVNGGPEYWYGQPDGAFFYYNDWPGGEAIAIPPSGSISDGAWHHIVGVYRSSTHTKTIYIDGGPPVTTNMNCEIADTHAPLIIGGNWLRWSDNLPAGYPITHLPCEYPAYTGEVDEARIYQGALSTADVQFLFAHPSGGLGNAPPTALDDSYQTNEDTALCVSAADGLLRNDTDADADPLTAALVGDPAHGTLTLQPDGAFVYMPSANWNGTDTFTYRVYDGVLYSNVATVTITVTPVNDAPIAEAGPEQTLEGNAAGGANVTLDGSGSSDVESDTLTYLWTWTDQDGKAQTATEQKPTILLPVGETTVTLVVNDGQADSQADTVKITVTDTTPPTVTDLTASPNELWPPNGKMRDVTLAYTVSDIVDASCDVAIVVTCNEADFRQADDVQQVDKTHLKLRAKRDGKSKDGRIYTITLTATDDAGKKTQAQVTVTVPHDQGKGAGLAQIGSAAAVGTAAGAQIVFSLSSDAEVAVTVTNMAGRPVRQLAAGQACAAGVNTLLWNGRSDRGTAVPAGMYVVRISAQAPGGAQTAALTVLRLGR